MTVTPSYPGVYIQELPSLVHTITAAPTSIAVFVGYTNPFFSGTEFGTAIRLFSFADYQANFGGFFSCPWQPDYVGQAVNQFFLNGGQTCYVVALQATTYYDGPDGAVKGGLSTASVTLPGYRREHHFHGQATSRSGRRRYRDERDPVQPAEFGRRRSLRLS